MMYQGKNEAPDLTTPSLSSERTANVGDQSSQYLHKGARPAAVDLRPRSGDYADAERDSRQGNQSRFPSRRSDEFPSVGASSPGSVSVLGRVIGAVRRQLWLVSGLAISVAFITLAIVLSLSERYTATTLLVVDQRDVRLVGLEAKTPGPGAPAPNVDGEVEIMKSSSIAQEVVARLGLATDPRFGVKDSSAGNFLVRYFQGGIDYVGAVILPSMAEQQSPAPNEVGADASLVQMEKEVGTSDPHVSPAAAPSPPHGNADAVAARALQKITAVRRRGLTNVIAIDVTADAPDEAARIANTYAETYIDGQVRSKLRSVERAEAALSKRVTELGEALRRSEMQIKTFALAQSGQPADETARHEIDRIQTSIAIATRDADLQATRLRELEDVLASHSYASLGQSLGVPEIALLDEQRRTLEQRLQRLSESEVRSTDVRQRLDLVNSQLQAISNQRIEPIRRQAESGKDRISSLKRELEQIIQRSDLTTNFSVQLFRLQQETAATRQLYQDYLGRLKAISQQRNIVTPDVYVVAEASPPPVRSFPPRTLLVVLGSAAGLALAVSVGYVRDNYPSNLKFVEELEEVTRVPNVGIIPVAKVSLKSPKPAPEDEIFDCPMSPYSEAIRRLRVSLNLVVNEGAGFKSLIVTSAHAGEGKSTIALSLARTATEVGLKVVLVDCNLRNPNLHDRLGLNNHEGLAQLLLAPSGVPEPLPIKLDPRSSCAIITSGGLGDIAPDRPLQSAHFGKLMRELESKFDLIILDTPPVGAAADPLIIVQQVDAVLLIARSGRAVPRDVQTASDEITRAKARDLVTALNFAAQPNVYLHGYFAGGSKS